MNVFFRNFLFGDVHATLPLPQARKTELKKPLGISYCDMKDSNESVKSEQGFSMQRNKLANEVFQQDTFWQVVRTNLDKQERSRIQTLNKFAYAESALTAGKETQALGKAHPPLSKMYKFVESLDQVPDDAKGLYMTIQDRDTYLAKNRIRGAR
jgi:hypothetical protein